MCALSRPWIVDRRVCHTLVAALPRCPLNVVLPIVVLRNFTALPLSSLRPT